VRLIRGGWQLHARAEPLDHARERAIMDALMAGGLTTFESADIYRGVDTLLREFTRERRARGLAPPRVHARISFPGEPDGGAIAAASAALRERLGEYDLVQVQARAIDARALARLARALASLEPSIGLMNVDADALDAVLAAGVKPRAVQAQCSLIDRRALVTLAPAAREAGVEVIAFGALCGGFLAERWRGAADPRDRAEHPEYRAMVEEFGGWAALQRLLDALALVARRQASTISAVALAWVLAQPGITRSLIGVSSAERLPELARADTMTLAREDLAAIDAILREAPMPRGPVGAMERDPASAIGRAIAARAHRG
jgi:aryl-alcohol dehydrogenase-like predicted oxidoreductase